MKFSVANWRHSFCLHLEWAICNHNIICIWTICSSIIYIWIFFTQIIDLKNIIFIILEYIYWFYKDILNSLLLNLYFLMPVPHRVKNILYPKVNPFSVTKFDLDNSYFWNFKYIVGIFFFFCWILRKSTKNYVKIRFGQNRLMWLFLNNFINIKS